MLPPALLDAIDRLLDTLMGVARAACFVATNRTTPAQPADAAHLLLHRVTRLVIRLIRLSNDGLPAPRQPKQDNPANNPDIAEALNTPARGPIIRRRPGWLLAALPDDAPALAAQLADALADPALAPLLDAVPTLRNTLKPILRALGLHAPAAPRSPPPPLLPPRPPASSPNPAPPPPASHAAQPATPAPNQPPPAAPSHAHFVTILQQNRHTHTPS